MILFVEDGDFIADLANNLSQKGYDVEWVTNFMAASYKLKVNPGAFAYEAVILDLDISPIGLPYEALDTAKEYYGGWAFYKHVLCAMPELQEHTIFLTGFYNGFKEKIGEELYESLNVIGKNDLDQLNKIIRLLRRFKKIKDHKR